MNEQRYLRNTYLVLNFFFEDAKLLQALAELLSVMDWEGMDAESSLFKYDDSALIESILDHGKIGQ
jgi:hypothetical protein